MADEPLFPPVISDPYDKVKPIGTLPIGAEIKKPGIFGRSDDPAKYVIARSRFLRPVLAIPNSRISFEWPNGVEGISINGTVGNARHKYIGDNADVVQVMHRDSRTIELSGQFNGRSASTNVRKLMEVVSAVSPAGYWLLALPGNLNAVLKEQLVNIENYSFEHPQDDRTDSWDYSITFIRVGVGKKLPQEQYSPVLPTNPKPGKATPAPKGKDKRVYTVHAGGRTLRAAAQLMFHNPDRWREIYNKNRAKLDALNYDLHVLPTKNLPLGMKLYY